MKQEIKCPHCKEWTLWQGHMDDRCLYCGEFLQSKEFVDEIERRAKNQYNGGFFFFKPDQPKINPEKFKKGTFMYVAYIFVYYLQMAFFFFISLLIAMIALMPG